MGLDVVSKAYLCCKWHCKTSPVYLGRSQGLRRPPNGRKSAASGLSKGSPKLLQRGTAVGSKRRIIDRFITTCRFLNCCFGLRWVAGASGKPPEGPGRPKGPSKPPGGLRSPQKPQKPYREVSVDRSTATRTQTLE